MSRRLNLALLALVLVFGLSYYWLLIDNRPGNAQPKPVTIAELRSLAASIPGQAPSQVGMDLIAFRRLPGTLFAAGSGLKRRLIGVMVWQLKVPGRGPIVIDTGISAADARKNDYESFDAQAAARAERVMRSASMILVTHEHPDHLGGLLALGDRALLEKVKFNPAQIPGNPVADRLDWPSGARPVASVSGLLPSAVAPGVVVIPAPAHSPGSQLIYVRLVSGHEYLFVGDASSLALGWQQNRARSRLLTDYLITENRTESFAWLATIRALEQANPGMVVLPGHDFEWVLDNKQQNGIEIPFAEGAD